MKDYDPAIVAYLLERKALVKYNLFWITAKHRDTGSLAEFGMWDGPDNQNIAVLSPITGTEIVRPYTSFGAMLAMDNIPLVSDLTIRNIKVSLSHLNLEVQEAFRQYDPRLAPVEIHRIYLDQDTMLPLAAAQPRFVGYVNEAPIERPAVGGEGSMAVTCVSHTRQLTKTNPGKRSDETQKRRSGDRFRKYSTIAGDVSYWWGEKKGNSNGQTVNTSIHQIFIRGR